MSVNPQWYYGKGQERAGPFGDAELHGFIASGRVAPETLVWRDGFAAWTPAARVPELTTAFAQRPTAMPVPPVSPGPLQSPQYAEGGGVSSIIPYRNGHALAGYYCGIFSLVPVFGLVLGPVALVLGVLGLKNANRDPAAKGKGHAWVAIILGSITTLGHLAFGILVVAAMARR